MTQFVELEISLQRIDTTVHVALRFDRSDSESDVAPILGLAAFDLDALRAMSGDRKEYGRLLSQSLFADPKIKSAFDKGCVMAESLDMAIRLRLAVDKSAADLHSLVWESLCDIDTGDYLATRERLLISRFISRDDWRPVHLRAKDEMRALVAIASPGNVGTYQPGGRALAPVDVAGETQRATAGLGTIPATVIGGQGTGTLNNIVGKLREGYDILVLVCHGAFIGGNPLLYLEDDSGNVAVVHGTDLATRLSELKQRPRLVVLASCESAGTGASGDEGVLAALGPRLAEAGIPAVIAMQGSITMQTAGEFMPVFFHELQEDGQIDRALAIARGTIRARPDWWMPVLFMSLKRGRIWWYTPGFTGEQEGFDRWPSLVSNIRKGRCTPILGSGLLESLVGSFREIARQWAKKYRYPMAGEECEELPLVAQYIAIDQGEETFVRDEFSDALRAGVLRQYPEISEEIANGPIQNLISVAGTIRREQESDEPHQILAGLNLPVYLSTNPDNLLADALIAAGKKPVVALCPRRDDTGDTTAAEAPDFEPSKDAPLVYHLFGHLRDPESIVLTQDNYFDYLIDVTRNNDIIPTSVRAKLTNTALLFLGFQLRDWDFRVFFSSIKGREGRALLGKYAHVAVKIDPEQDRTVDPKRARQYLERYFSNTKISIYWGRAEDFLKELQREMNRKP
ncbi:MAG: CHAT domain-containing protein [Chthoniobacteraceae bacterium]